MTTSVKPAPVAPDAWAATARLLVRWLEKNERVDALLDSLPRTLGRAERARCQHLLFGVVRHLGRLERAIKALVAREPRARLQVVLLLAGYELIEGGDEGHVARVVHHAVEQAKQLASPSEAKLVNAVVRRLVPLLAEQEAPGALAPAEELAAWFSHPTWLVERWLAEHGAKATRALLEWNQQPGPVQARWRRRDRGPEGAEAEFLVATPWAGFYEVKSGHWAEVERLVAEGSVFLQDPATRLAVELLAPAAGESVLDLCAAPGGKSLAIADALGSGRVVAMDLAGPRIERLKENLSRAGAVDVALVQGDLATTDWRLFDEHRLPVEYPAVLLDVPCSNTGVMRHRVDVKWRLQPGDFRKHAKQQLGLLHAAARLVAPGGRLVYSTCSLDAEENEQVVKAFFDSRAGGAFERGESRISRPWETGHDGAAAFLLKRRT